MDIEEMNHEYLKSATAYQSQETKCINNIIKFERQRCTIKKNKIKAFLDKHQNIYWARFGCTDFSTQFECYETIHDFMDKFTIEKKYS